MDSPMNPSAVDLIRELCNTLDRYKPLILAALDYAHHSHTYDDVCVAVLQNRVRLWSLPNSFMLTEVVDMPQKRHYHVWLAGGDLEEILATEQDLFQAARDAQCQNLTMAGRTGWLKPLGQRLGWKTAYVTLYKEVPYEPQGRRADNGSEAAEGVAASFSGAASAREEGRPARLYAVDGTSSRSLPTPTDSSV